MGQLNHNLGSCEQRIMELLNNTNIKNLRPYVLVLNKPGGKWKIIKTKAPKKSIYTLIPFFNLADGRWARQQPHRAKAGSPPNPSFLEGSIRMVTVSLNIFNGICWNPPTPQASGTCFSCDPNECENPSALSQTFSEMEIATQEPMIGKWLTAAWKNSVGNRFLLDFPDLEGRSSILRIARETTDCFRANVFTWGVYYTIKEKGNQRQHPLIPILALFLRNKTFSTKTPNLSHKFWISWLAQ